IMYRLYGECSLMFLRHAAVAPSTACSKYLDCSSTFQNSQAPLTGFRPSNIQAARSAVAFEPSTSESPSLHFAITRLAPLKRNRRRRTSAATAPPAKAEDHRAWHDLTNPCNERALRSDSRRSRYFW